MALYRFFTKQVPEVPSPTALCLFLSLLLLLKMPTDILPVSLWHGNSVKNGTPNISVDMVAPYYGLDSERCMVHGSRFFAKFTLCSTEY